MLRACSGASLNGSRRLVMREAVILLIRAYQLVLAPLLPPNTCRFIPTCSQYAIDAVRKYGILSGGWRAVKRIGKCHPYHPGGYDPA
jgi:uncharacterized protein